MWTASSIIKQLAGDLRRPILASFWRHAEPDSRGVATSELAHSLSYRPQKLRKASPEKKAGLLATRLNTPEYQQIFEMSLMLFFTHERNELLGAFLDAWGIPHEDGTIEDEAEVEAPSVDAVRAAAANLAERYPREEIRLYLATAGLLMGEDWEAAAWPVVDEMQEEASS